MKENKIGLVVHGGAGTMERGKMTPEREREYRAGIENALRAGLEILQHGGSSLDATEAAVRTFEDDPLFNAGKGSVFSAAGINEMDAAIIDGKTLKAGAVADVRHVKNPISLARLVMEKSPHVLMAGEGAGVLPKNRALSSSIKNIFSLRNAGMRFRKQKRLKKRAALATRNSSLLIRTCMEQLARSHWIEMEIWPLQLRPGEKRIN